MEELIIQFHTAVEVKGLSFEETLCGLWELYDGQKTIYRGESFKDFLRAAINYE